jgi:hypothetical protein
VIRVARMPSWMLRTILRMSIMRDYWAEAFLELWRRDVVEAVAAETDLASGPWPTAMPPGMH